MIYYDANGDEIEAFSQKEVDAQIKEALTDTTGKVKEAEDALAAKTTEFDKLSKQYDDKKNSYKELQDKSKEDGEKYKEVLERDTNAYNTSIEEKITKIAGTDKDYATELKKQLEGGVGSETTDEAAIDKQIAKAQALTNIELSREVHSPASGEGGAPDFTGETANFTETPSGKDTYEALSDMQGTPRTEDKK
jgi:chromosome segregation ATPase